MASGSPVAEPSAAARARLSECLDALAGIPTPGTDHWCHAAMMAAEQLAAACVAKERALLQRIADAKDSMEWWADLDHFLNAALRAQLAPPMDQHEIAGFQEQKLSNSPCVWNDGYDRVVCTCGWTSVAVQRNKVALVAMHTAHAGRVSGRDDRRGDVDAA